MFHLFAVFAPIVLLSEKLVSLIFFYIALDFVAKLNEQHLLDVMPRDDPRKQTFAVLALSRNPNNEAFSRNFFRVDDVCLSLQRKNDDLYVLELGMGQPMPEQAASRPICRYLHIKERCQFERFVLNRCSSLIPFSISITFPFI